MSKGTPAEIILDEDVRDRLERLRQERNVSFTEAVNEALREGLAQLRPVPRSARHSFHTKSVSLGGCLLPNLDNIAEALTLGEGEDFG
jgi:hypothetical protein